MACALSFVCAARACACRRSRHGFLFPALVGALLLATAASSATDAKRFDRNGIAFSYPERWFVTANPLSSAGNPVYRFAVSTKRVQRTRSDIGPCLPGVAKQLGATDAFAFVREALGADRARTLPRVPARPRTFRLPRPNDHYLCGFGGRPTLSVSFAEGGRVFYLWIYVGSRASPANRSALQRLLNTMVIDRR
jgi:hypothetical protein